MSDGVTITNALTIKAEALEGFLKALPDMLKETAKAPGLRNLVVVRNKDKTNQIMFIETWDTEDAFKKYIAWRTERGDIEKITSVLDGPRELNFWPNVVARI